LKVRIEIYLHLSGVAFLYWFSWNSVARYSFADICYTKFYVNRIKNIENMGNISFTFPSLAYFSLADSHETSSCSTTWHGNRLYWLLSKSCENCRKCGQIYITLTRKVWLLLYWSSRNKSILKGITWRYYK
jgi:hypothetical protein